MDANGTEEFSAQNPNPGNLFVSVIFSSRQLQLLPVNDISLRYSVLGLSL